MRRARACWRWLVGLFRDMVPLVVCISGGLLMFAAGSAPDGVPGWVVFLMVGIAGLFFMGALDIAHSRAKAEETAKWASLLTGMISEERTTEITVVHEYPANREAE